MTWFAYCLVVALFTAYIATRALMPGAWPIEVFAFTAPTALLGYSVGLWQETVWQRRPWRETVRSSMEGVVYALLMGSVFAFFWPG